MRKNIKLVACATLALLATSAVAANLTMVDEKGTPVTSKVTNVDLLRDGELYVGGEKGFCLLPEGLAEEQNINLAKLAEQLYRNVADINCTRVDVPSIEYKLSIKGSDLIQYDSNGSRIKDPIEKVIVRDGTMFIRGVTRFCFIPKARAQKAKLDLLDVAEKISTNQINIVCDDDDTIKIEYKIQ